MPPPIPHAVPPPPPQGVGGAARQGQDSHELERSEGIMPPAALHGVPQPPPPVVPTHDDAWEERPEDVDRDFPPMDAHLYQRGPLPPVQKSAAPVRHHEGQPPALHKASPAVFHAVPAPPPPPRRSATPAPLPEPLPGPDSDLPAVVESPRASLFPPAVPSENPGYSPSVSGFSPDAPVLPPSQPVLGPASQPSQVPSWVSQAHSQGLPAENGGVSQPQQPQEQQLPEPLQPQELEEPQEFQEPHEFQEPQEPQEPLLLQSPQTIDKAVGGSPPKQSPPREQRRRRMEYERRRRRQNLGSVELRRLSLSKWVGPLSSSTRVCRPPLAFWLGEQVVYERKPGSLMPTIAGVVRAHVADGSDALALPAPDAPVPLMDSPEVVTPPPAKKRRPPSLGGIDLGLEDDDFVCASASTATPFEQSPSSSASESAAKHKIVKLRGQSVGRAPSQARASSSDGRDPHHRSRGEAVRPVKARSRSREVQATARRSQSQDVRVGRGRARSLSRSRVSRQTLETSRSRRPELERSPSGSRQRGASSRRSHSASRAAPLVDAVVEEPIVDGPVVDGPAPLLRPSQTKKASKRASGGRTSQEKAAAQLSPDQKLRRISVGSSIPSREASLARSSASSEDLPQLLPLENGFCEMPKAEGSSFPCQVRKGSEFEAGMCMDVRIPPSSFPAAERLSEGRSLLVHITSAERGAVQVVLNGVCTQVGPGDTFRVQAGTEYCVRNASKKRHVCMKLVLITLVTVASA